jgi:hypothetical protein
MSAHETAHPSVAGALQTSGATVTAAEFRKSVDAFGRTQQAHAVEAQRAAAEERNREVATLLHEHVQEAGWQTLLSRAQTAARNGETECQLLRFPAALCSDGGRAINVPERGWPQSLRGEAAEIYAHWDREMRPRGFGIAARVLDFPGGMPGDIGLFLTWKR